MKKTNLIKTIAIIAVLSAILFVQEQILSILPNIQLTVFLIILYSKTLKLKNTLIIVLIHTILDNILIGSIYLIPVMYIGWSMIVLGIYIFLKKCENSLVLGCYAIIGSLVYSLIFAVYHGFFVHTNFIAYLIADIPYVILLGISSFLTTIWLYKPLNLLINKYIQEGEI